MSDSSMKVLHISKYFYPHDGGIESVCRDIMQALKKHPEIEQMCLCFGDERKKRYAGHMYGFPIIRVAPFVTVKKQALSLKYYFILRKIIHRFQPDVVHVHFPNMLVCLFLLLIPKSFRLIIHWHSDIIEQKHLYRCFRFIEQRCLKRADLILATTEKYIDGSSALERWRSKCRVCPNIADVEKYEMRPEDAGRIQQVKEKYKDPIVFFIGRHVKYKGLELLIRAAELVRVPCHFVIAGTGPLTEKLKEMKGDNVSFIGRISDDELRIFFHASKILAFPSITKNEAFGVSLAEGMSCGLPAITFTIPGSGVNVVSIGGETGIEVARQTPEDLADGIVSLLSDENEYKRFSENAKTHIRKNFTRPVLEKALDDIYREAAALKQG